MKFKIKFFILFCLLHFSSFSQTDESDNYELGKGLNNKTIEGNEADSLVPYPTKIYKSWKDVEHKVSKEIINAFIFRNKKYFQEFFEAKFDSYNLKHLRKLLHFVDINNDGKLDVIFEIDKPLDEIYSVLIFLNTSENRYKLILDIPRFIDGFIFKNKKLIKLYITKPGCCMERNVLKYEFSFEYNNINFPIIKRTHFSIEQYYVHSLDSTFYKENFITKIVTNHKIAQLRSSPKIVDSLIDYYEYTSRKYEDMGNIIASIKRDSKFLILGFKRDSEKRKWFYIQVPLNCFTKDKQELEFHTEKFSTLSTYGWIDEANIKMD